jgi:hypothetical protein
MRDLGAIAIVSLFLASGIVAMWRQILTLCIIICLAVIFAGLLGIASEAKGLFTRAQIARSITASQSWRSAVPDPHDQQSAVIHLAVRPGRVCGDDGHGA